MAINNDYFVLFYGLVKEYFDKHINSDGKVDFVFFHLISLSLIILLFQSYVRLVTIRLKNDTQKDKQLEIERLTNANSLMYIGILIALMGFITYNTLL